MPLEAGENTLYIVPQNISLKDEPAEKTIVYFRSKEIFDKSVFKISDENGNVLFEKKYPFLRPPEMEKVLVDFGAVGLTAGSKLTATIEEVSA